MKLKSTRILLLLFLFCSCSNEPLEIELGSDNNMEEEIDDPQETPEDILYATAKLDGQNFFGNQFEIDTLSSTKLQLSFFSELEQQIYLILPNPPVLGSYSVTQSDDEFSLYSGAFINSVGNISESTFYSTEDTGEITINSYNSETNNISGSFAFDVATLNNNVKIITEGEFDLQNE